MGRFSAALIYIFTASRMLLDIWGIRGGTDVDPYAKIALSCLVLAVISPLFSLLSGCLLPKIINIFRSQLP